MKCSILCPGPSLAQYRADHFAGLMIGINRAAIAFPVDVWACCDYPAIRDNQDKVIGTPTLLTRRQTWDDFHVRSRLRKVAIVEHISADDPPKRWNLRTMTCAMMYAWSRGAKFIEIFGCDWKGTQDFDGTEAGENRSDDRWREEMNDAGELMRWLMGRGVTTMRRLKADHGNH